MPRIRITLEAALKRADMSGRELERLIRIHRDTIGKYRHNAVRMVSLNVLEHLCGGLGCQLTDLFTDMIIAPHGQPRQGIRPPLPDGTPCPKSREHMSSTDFDTWIELWFDAWEQARGARV